MIHPTSGSVLQVLDEQPGEHLRRLVAYCQELARQYQTTPAVVLERAWWQSFYQAGTRLRDSLEEHRDHWHALGLTDKEVEQAYLMLIHVAYFFEPGGVAEALFKEQGWAWSDGEQGLESWQEVDAPA
jgi:hypothetical protein